MGEFDLRNKANRVGARGRELGWVGLVKESIEQKVSSMLKAWITPPFGAGAVRHSSVVFVSFVVLILAVCCLGFRNQYRKPRPILTVYKSF